MKVPRSEVDTAVVHVDYGGRASYYDDWLDAITRAPAFRVASFNIARASERRCLARAIASADVVALLHSVTADSLIYAEQCRHILQNRRGKLISFVGNEVNLPSAPLGPKIAFLRAIEADVIATQLLQEAGDYLYANVTSAKVVSIPHALNPSAFHPLTPQKDRVIDVGTRSFKYLAYLGDDDRNRIHDYFSTRRFSPPLRIDISTQDRLTRPDWAAFLNRCKATVSTEAGSHWLERDDRTALRIRDWMHDETRARGGLMIPFDSPLRRLGHTLPWRLKERLRPLLSRGPLRHEAFAAELLDFQTVYDRFFRDVPTPPVSGKCISSRHFDAVGTKTCQIMFPGRFNDILEAGEHYIAISRDFSNIDDVLFQFRDLSYRQAMLDRTFEYVMEQHTYAHRLRQVEMLLRSGP